jgi:hypothetical protein
MSKLKELAKVHGLYTQQDIPERYNGNLQHRLSLSERDDIIPEFFKTMPPGYYEADVFFQTNDCVSNIDGSTSYSLERSMILVHKIGSPVFMELRDDRHKKFYLQPYYGQLTKYNNIYYALRNRAADIQSEPNKIGVFSMKKLNDWAFYCEAYVNSMEALLVEHNAKNVEIEKDIKRIITSMPPGTKFVSHNGINTYLTGRFFCIEITHDRSSACMGKKISFTGNTEDVIAIENLMPEKKA